LRISPAAYRFADIQREHAPTKRAIAAGDAVAAHQAKRLE
jgi:hypothetical protein